jgi:hypothetical protein
LDNNCQIQTKMLQCDEIFSPPPVAGTRCKLLPARRPPNLRTSKSYTTHWAWDHSHVLQRVWRDTREGHESMQRAPLFKFQKTLELTYQLTKLNSDCTIKFVSINSSKQDFTWIYLDKVTSRLHSR